MILFEAGKDRVFVPVAGYSDVKPAGVLTFTHDCTKGSRYLVMFLDGTGTKEYPEEEVFADESIARLSLEKLSKDSFLRIYSGQGALVQWN